MSAPSVEETLGHLLWEVSARTALHGEASLTGTRLTLPAVGLLESIDAEPGITIAEVARRRPKSQQAISQVVARLEKLGWLERRLGNGRRIGLYITDAGRAALSEGLALEAGFEAGLRELLGAKPYEQLRVLLGDALLRIKDWHPESNA